MYAERRGQEGVHGLSMDGGSFDSMLFFHVLNFLKTGMYHIYKQKRYFLKQEIE